MGLANVKVFQNINLNKNKRPSEKQIVYIWCSDVLDNPGNNNIIVYNIYRNS